MKRAGCLFFAVAPVATLLVFLLGPDKDDAGSGAQDALGGRPTSSPADLSEEEERELDERIAEMPPGLAAPKQKELAQQIVASAENSTLDWRGQFDYIEDIGDGNGYTAGIIGFCSGTHDMLTLVERYTKDHPDNGLAEFLPALREVDGTDSHDGLGKAFTTAWAKEAERPAFRELQISQRDKVYFDPAVRMAKMDGLGTLGQFMYYDAMVLHGPGTGERAFYGIRETAMKQARTKAEGGKESTYLDAFLDARRDAMKSRKAHRDTSRIDTAQRVFLRDGNLALKRPLTWKMYGETFKVPQN
ncbi:Chitosanase precursor [Streptomyces sp. YIM 130001]|uniref:chitosanase n=1 Tax=Streptomyces sp. YIM 130001 TaxID=2259644 RepID=UPI000E65B29C|nr:chitosanase [Streptomyces sp. YIM 130001]RII18359.1 Chitosanase precursor [Streptomyces sp. YIM 130001]